MLQKVTTTVYNFNKDGAINCHTLFDKGMYVVGVAFINNSDGVVKINNRFDLAPGDPPKVMNIPSGCVCVDIYEYKFMQPDGKMSLEIELTIAQTK
jgi:hypothetical protein